MAVTTDKRKIMAFQGKDLIPNKICISDQILERINQFSYLGVKLSDISDKILKSNNGCCQQYNENLNTCTHLYETCSLLWQ